MTPANEFMLSLCLWREARGEDVDGMTAVACVVRNRVIKNDSSYYAEVTKPWQFSSITAKDDPQLNKWPLAADASMAVADGIALAVADGNTEDVTMGATLYYDDSISFPESWDKTKVSATVKIGRFNFFKEI
jgi:spore germination cell wall hydrolase CwlJ-like protein